MMLHVKKNNILVLPLLLTLLIGMSGLKVQAQSFQWGAIGGGLNSMQTSGQWFRVVDLATYRDGRVYSLAMTGTWNLKVAGQSLPGFADIGSTEIALSSFNDQGQHQWTKVIGSNDGASPARVFTDPFGSVYVTGNNIGWRQN